MAKPAVLIAALSGRALAAAARRAGYVPLVVDCFADEDTRALAQACVRLTADLRRGLQAEELLSALTRLSASLRTIGVVYGSGFEDRPHLLDELAVRFRLLGNSAEMVRCVKDPCWLARLCRSRGVPHPKTRLSPPGKLDGWLAKRRGGAGGSHIRAAGQQPASAGYYQRWVAGVPVSALVLANGARMMLLGFSRQWPSPSQAQPFRYGGAVRPASLSGAQAAALKHAIDAIGRALPLFGLCSLDFLVAERRFWLLEINPRPGATLDIFEPATGSLFALHLAALAGELPRQAPQFADAAAQAIIYAERPIARLPAIAWPDWSRDRQSATSSVGAGEPVCSVVASGPSPAAAQALIARRSVAIRQLLEA